MVIPKNEKHNEPERTFQTIEDLSKAIETDELKPAAFKPVATKTITEKILPLAKIPDLSKEHKMLESFWKKAAK